MNNNTNEDFTNAMLAEYLRLETERYREIDRATIRQVMDSRPPYTVEQLRQPIPAPAVRYVGEPQPMEDTMRTNVQDPLERRSREALNRHIERLAAFEVAAANRHGKTQQEETKMDIPKEIVLLIEKHPASTVTLALLRQATKTPVPQECVGDATKIKEWLAGCDGVTWPTQTASRPSPAVNPPTMPLRRPQNQEFCVDGLRVCGDAIHVSFRGDCCATARASVSSCTSAYGTEIIDFSDLPEEVDSLDELVDAILDQICEPEMEGCRDGVDFDIDHDYVDWDTLDFDDFTDTERECSGSDIEQLAQWLIDQGHVTLNEEEE